MPEKKPTFLTVPINNKLSVINVPPCHFHHWQYHPHLFLKGLRSKMAVFAYGCVSTHEQTTENQKLEIQRTGFNVNYWFEDVGVSDKTSATQRMQFLLLLQKIHDSDTIVISKLDRLGRDAIDILSSIKLLLNALLK